MNGSVLERVGEPTAVARAVASQHSPRQGAPGNAPHALVEAERDHLALLLAVDEVVVVLHGDEIRPAVRLCRVLRLGELPREHAAGPYVTRLARPDHVVQGAHGLLNRGPGVPTMDLVQVDVVHVQPTQRRVDTREDVLAAQPTAVLAGRHRHEHLGGDHRLVSAEELREPTARSPPRWRRRSRCRRCRRRSLRLPRLPGRSAPRPPRR